MGLGRPVEELRQHVRYALRSLIKSWTFTLAVVGSLAIGVGAIGAVYSVIDAVLIRALPVPNPDRLVEVTRPEGGALSYPMYEFIRDRSDALEGALSVLSGRIAASARVEKVNLGDVNLSIVSADYFSTLGVAPVIGRTFTKQDLDTPNTAVIGYALWQRAFGRDPAVLGRGLRLGGRLQTIVGVAPEGFEGLSAGQPVDLWVPATWLDRRALQNPEAFMFRVMGRLRPQASLGQAQANLHVLAQRSGAEWKLETDWHVAGARSGLSDVTRRFVKPLWILFTIVGLLLLITVANIASLHLARSSARQREIEVRLAIGASRWQVIRQLLTESFVLGAAGSALGILVVPPAAASLVRFLAPSVGRFDLTFSYDVRMLLFTVAAGMVATLAFGLAPALAATRANVALISADRSAPIGSSSMRPRKAVVVLEVAVAFVLLAGAILFSRSLLGLSAHRLGFTPDNVLLLQTSTAGPGAITDQARMYERVLTRLASVPGVRGAALSSEALFSGNARSESVITPETMASTAARDAVLLAVSPGFFRTMETRMLGGRDFEWTDDKSRPRAAIVNEAAARYFWPGREALGQTFKLNHPEFPEPLNVIGVVETVTYTDRREQSPRMVYLPYLQTGPLETASLAVRTVSPDLTTDMLWKEVSTESRSLRLGNMTTQRRLVDATVQMDLMLAQLAGAFAVTAALLVCVGVFGLSSYEMSQRRLEIAIRMALGARSREVVWLMVRRSLTLVGLGVVIGLGAALALGRVVESLLYGVRGYDVITLSLAGSLILLVAVATVSWPAWRGARLDPASLQRT
jgi:predicted permease